jgi:GST-like protein
MASTPYLGGGFGHFYAYAPEKLEYPINRFAMEVKRQLDVLDRNLAERRYVAGAEYTIADMAIFPWYGGLVNGELYDAGEFLDVKSYRERPALVGGDRGAAGGATRDSGSTGPGARKELRVVERHSASDFK